MVTEKRLKKKSSNSDDNCESDIENGEKFFFFKESNFHIAVFIPHYYPKFMENGLKSAFLVGFGQNKAQK